jgi:fermentation-respiration switch protein FrsA (DUF1100 family)
MKSIKFPSGRLNLYGVLSLPTHFDTGVLFLHGGGVQASTALYTHLQEKFSKQKIASLAFDFRGCGQSEGNFEEGSLANRLADAEAAMQFLMQKSKLPESRIYLWGSSMGGHLVCRLSELHPELGGIILQSAAAYSKASEVLPLNHQFTEAISQPESWVNSPAFAALANYFGNLLIIYGDHDTVVPDGVKFTYQQLAQIHHQQFMTLFGGTHRLLHPQTESEEQVLGQLANLTLNFIRGT